MHWQSLSRNPSLNIDFVMKYIDKPWNVEHISRINGITTEFIELFPVEQWNWNWFSFNKSITIDTVIKYFHLPFTMGLVKFNRKLELSH